MWSRSVGQDGTTPLYWASQKDHHDVAEVLLMFGATIDLPCDVR